MKTFNFFFVLISLFVSSTVYAVIDPTTPNVSTSVPRDHYIAVYVETRAVDAPMTGFQDGDIAEVAYPYSWSDLRSGQFVLIRGGHGQNGVIVKITDFVSGTGWMTNSGDYTVTEGNFLGLVTRRVANIGPNPIPQSCWNIPAPDGSVRVLTRTHGTSMIIVEKNGYQHFPLNSVNTAIIGYPYKDLRPGAAIYWSSQAGSFVNHNLKVHWPDGRWTCEGQLGSGTSVRMVQGTLFVYSPTPPMSEIVSPKNFVCVVCKPYRELPNADEGVFLKALASN